MDATVAPLPPLTAVPFMDDVISPATSFDDFLSKLELFLGRLLELGLRLRLDKCSFCQPSVAFLGHVITAAGLAVDPRKTEAIDRLARPTTVPDVRRIMGMFGYYRPFVPHFAELAAPLHALTKKHSRYVWSPDCERSFLTLKRLLVSPPVLAFPDPHRPYILATDASKSAVGAVLSQPYPEGDRPVAFFSRQLKDAETRYFVSELEGLAVVSAIKHFRTYLFGNHFTLVTDHRALLFLQSPRTELSDRLQRWGMALLPFKFTVVFRKGSAHTNADALSRLPVVASLAVPDLVDPLLSAQISDPLLGPTRELLLFKTPPDPSIAQQVHALAHHLHLDDQRLRLVFRAAPADEPRLVVPSSLREPLLRAAHDLPSAGHLATDRTLARLSAYYWPSMRSDVTNWCRSCATCAHRYSPRTAPAGLLQPLEPTYPGQFVVVDFLGPLPTATSGNKHILIFSDHYSKWVETVAVTNADAVTVAHALVERIVCRLGPPSVLLSDQGTHFKAQLVHQICALLHIDQRHSTAYHPQTQGLVERFNSTLVDMLSKFCSADQKDWDLALPLVTWSYNSSVHPSTGFSPFEVLYGIAPRSPFDLVLDPPMLSASANKSVADYVTNLRERLVAARALVLDNLDKTRETYRRTYNAAHRDVKFEVGDRVLLYTPFPRKGLSPKLQSLWTGPWTVIDRVNPINYVIELNGRRQLVPLTRLKPTVTRLDHPSIPPQPSSTASTPATAPAASPADPRATASPPRQFVVLPAGALPLPVPIGPPNVFPHPVNEPDNIPDAHEPDQPEPEPEPEPAPAPVPQPAPLVPEQPDNGPHQHPQDAPIPPDDDGFFLIDTLLDRRPTENRRGHRYLVRWAGYGDEHNLWRPRYILPSDFTNAYDAAHPDGAPRPRPPGQPGK